MRSEVALHRLKLVIGCVVALAGLILAGCAPAGPAGRAPGVSALAEPTDALLTILRATPSPAALEPSAPLDPMPLETGVPGTAAPTDSPLDTQVMPEASTPTPGPTTAPAFNLCCPLSDFPRQNLPKLISVPYRPPPQGVDGRHQGVDFVYHRLAGVERSILGVPVQAVLAGTVAAAVADSFPYGNLVIVETPGEQLPPDLAALLGLQAGESLYHLYAHLLEPPPVALGQSLEACQVIGAVGASGNTEAPHLHFETRRGPPGGRFPSMNAFVTGATPEERANYVLWRTSRQYLHFDPMILLSYGLGGS